MAQQSNTGGTGEVKYLQCTSVGTLQIFKETDDWNTYYEIMEQYFVANFIDDKRKIAVLLTCVGSDTKALGI
ncbi:hypothetical protein QE152_g19183 [Popillia japonica]|uniref:Uncharacterized protein n=1 Tax=Popillia japonica TaxID=7064 RepID=A0AAW1L0M7_POPJA